MHSFQYQIFRTMLAAAREECGITQVEIAAQLCKPQSFVSKYERGERRLDFTEFVELANLLEIDAADFIKRYQSVVAPSTIHKTRVRRKR
jgi:transcriptional regulator with XRE-family HTH domain